MGDVSDTVVPSLRLPPHKERAAQLLADGLTQRQVAERIGRHEVTLSRWKDDPNFVRRVEQLRTDLQRQADEVILDGVADAAKFVADVARGEVTTDDPRQLGARLRAALWILERGRKLHDATAIDLEKRANALTDKPKLKVAK